MGSDLGMKPSPLPELESSKEFRKLLEGEGSTESYVAAVRRESATYVSGVRAGCWRSRLLDLLRPSS